MLQNTDSPVPSLLFFGGPYGNLQALTALRAIAEDLGLTPSSIVCTGDTVAYCAQPYETVEEIRRWGVQVLPTTLTLQIGGRRPSGEGVGFRMSTARITWGSK